MKKLFVLFILLIFLLSGCVINRTYSKEKLIDKITDVMVARHEVLKQKIGVLKFDDYTSDGNIPFRVTQGINTFTAEYDYYFGTELIMTFDKKDGILQSFKYSEK